jgi:selenocysteine-specific elongation factor
MGIFASMIVGTAGHIDHGKTSLVRALTGVDTDRLKEEKARGISIELGYAYTPLPGGEVLGFVDVPGHERLIHTMAAGAGGIDFALLVIAADDGVMPQTREHAAILQLLGVAAGAVAISKTDRVDEERIAVVRTQIRELLAGTSLVDAPVFPIASIIPDDAGIAKLRDYLHSCALSWPSHDVEGMFRMAVDRVFTLPGHGTVVTGSARAGRVRVGDNLAVMPAGTLTRVRSIHAQSRDAEMGLAGQRCALNLVGIDKTSLSRGDWLADPRALLPSLRIDVRLRTLAGSAIIKNRAMLHIHLGTAHRVARITLLEGESLQTEAGAFAQLVFDSPICASPGDAFIARDAQALHTVGGGLVIDPVAPARRRASTERLAYLRALQSLIEGNGIAALLEEAPCGIEMRRLSRLCGRLEDAITLPDDSRVVGVGTERFAFLDSRWFAMREAALQTLRAFHLAQPDEPGIDRARLRRMSAPGASDSLWRILIEDLVQNQALLRSGHWLHLPHHRVTLSAREQLLADQLCATIAAGRFDPPWVRELAIHVQAQAEEVRSVLRKSVVQGELYQVVPDLFYHRERMRELSGIFRDLARQQPLVDAALFRDAVGVGRKRAIQILEFFDRAGYTRRIANGRALRTDSSWHDEFQ